MADQEPMEIQARIDELPTGGITYKTIKGHRYAYYQGRESGKQRSRRIKDDELESLSQQIEERKRLEGLLKREGAKAPASTVEPNLVMPARIGEQLERFCEPVAKWRKRECFARLAEYIYGKPDDRLLVLYGLRRTGKTTLVRQLIREMPPSTRRRTAFLQAGPNE